MSTNRHRNNFPMEIRPMLPTLVDKPFDSNDWVFEVKWDGIRSILFIEKEKKILKLQSRNGRLITHRYPEIVKVLNLSFSSSSQSAIQCKKFAILDGEIVILDNKTGLPSFQNHQRRMNLDSDREIEALSLQIPATYYFFDILYLDDRNLQDLTFLNRRKILSEVINENTTVKISDYIEDEGKKVFAKTTIMGLEGLIAKHKLSKYVQGVHSKDWLKIKHIKTQDCIIIGYTRREGNRENYFGSLLLAVYDFENKLKFAGHTGSGFNFSDLRLLYNKLKKMKIEQCPIDYIPYTNREPIWIKPELVAEIKFSGWTGDKIMRSPIFHRLREDKRPNECFWQKEQGTKKIIRINKKSSKNSSKIKKNKHKYNYTYPSFSNLDKVFWNKSYNHRQITKKDLVEYYDKISLYILPYLKNRPLSLRRYPDGIIGPSFYQKNWTQKNKPKYVQTLNIYSDSNYNHVINYVICNNKETLLWLANLGCIEINPWSSRINNSSSDHNNVLDPEKSSLNFPDFILFDLDPYIYSGQEKNELTKEPKYNIKAFKATVEVAFDLKDLLDDLKIESYVKTSGKTGLHIFVPIENSYTYKQTKTFAELIGKILIKRNPGKITMEWKISKRPDKVFFDHNQNAKGKTLVSIFSPRGVDSATVSFPLNWKDLSNVVPIDFTILNIPDILNKISNPWINILEKKQNLNRILDNNKEIL